MQPQSLHLWAPIAIGALALGIAIGANLTSSHKTHTPAAEAADQTPTVLYWYDPMVPDQHFDKPGPSPFMDMQLVPKYAEPATSAAGLSINPALVQNLGMRKTQVQRLPIHSELEVVGQLQFNQRNQAIVQLRAAGFVQKAWPLAVGDHVSAGQPLAEFHIPEWLDAQNELLSQPFDQNPNLLATLRARLQLLGVPDILIAKVEKTRQPETRVTITSPISGVVDMLDVKTGMALASGATLAKINNLDSLWLDAAIPEAQATGVRAGDKAIFNSVNPDDPALTGTLEYLLPSINDNSRTLTARILLENPEGRLKPGTSGRVVLRSSSKETGLFVPTEAVIRTGKRVLVMLAEPGGAFMPTNVVTGHEQGSQTRILQGLDEGQEVVASGQFLLDSEASFLGIAPKAAEKTMESHDHD
jgi:Cu(I)/Ag(I) efflux system membrane fusion protein